MVASNRRVRPAPHSGVDMKSTVELLRQENRELKEYIVVLLMIIAAFIYKYFII